MNLMLLTEYHLEFLSLKRGCAGLSEPTLVKMTHCWKSHVAAQMKTTYSLIAPYACLTVCLLVANFVFYWLDLDANYLTL